MLAVADIVAVSPRLQFVAGGLFRSRGDRSCGPDDPRSASLHCSFKTRISCFASAISLPYLSVSLASASLLVVSVVSFLFVFVINGFSQLCKTEKLVLVKNCILFLLVSNLLITGAMETHEAVAVHIRSEFYMFFLVDDQPQLSVRSQWQILYKATESSPMEHMDNLKDMLKEENIHLHTEAGEQEKLPLLILSLKGEKVRKETSCCVYAWLKHKQRMVMAYASRGYVAIGLDSRYHGERAESKTAYQDALISSWKNGNRMPFIFDTVKTLLPLSSFFLVSL
ncbi:hypothetical protein Bca4012_028267 [Brassica carinata]